MHVFTLVGYTFVALTSGTLISFVRLFTMTNYRSHPESIRIHDDNLLFYILYFLKTRHVCPNYDQE